MIFSGWHDQKYQKLPLAPTNFYTVHSDLLSSSNWLSVHQLRWPLVPVLFVHPLYTWTLLLTVRRSGNWRRHLGKNSLRWALEAECRSISTSSVFSLWSQQLVTLADVILGCALITSFTILDHSMVLNASGNPGNYLNIFFISANPGTIPNVFLYPTEFFLFI